MRHAGDRANTATVGSVLCFAVLGGGCSTISLGKASLTYPTSSPGEVNNVATYDEVFVYGALGENGLLVAELSTGEMLGALPPPPGTQSVDDLAAADGWLFLLDARSPGFLSVMSLADPSQPKVVGSPIEVPVGPFSGVSAGGGRVVVSGGTSALIVRRFFADGRLGKAVAEINLGRGHPDVFTTADGARAFVSIHEGGTRFGVSSVELRDPPQVPTDARFIELEGAGFTAGGARPASFPIRTALAGAVLYVAHGGGLAVVDVGDDFRLLRVVSLKVTPVAVAVSGDFAVVVGEHPRPAAVTLDVTDRTRPRAVRIHPLPDNARPTGVVMTDRRIAVAAHDAGLWFASIP